MSYTTNYYSIDRLFEDLLSTLCEDVPNKAKDILVRSNKKYDVFVNKKTQAVIFGFECPRCTKDDISLKYHDDYFELTFKEIQNDPDWEYRVRGRSLKEDIAAFYVDADKFDISKGKVDVKVANGYLTITIPMKKEYVKNSNINYDIN